MGLPDERFQRSVEVALAAPVARSFQRLPWKELELAWAESVLDVADPASRAEAARPLTFLSRGLDLLGSSRKEMYHLTHEVIYASDFGLRRFEPPRPLAEVLRDVDGAIVRTLDDDDFDLCAELLLVAPYAGAPWSPTALFALTAVMDVVERFGALPSMTFHPTSSTATTAAERRLYFLEESYHTQYVLGFLMLATLLPGTTPPVPPPGPPPVATLPARLSQSRAFWETTSAVPPCDVLVDVAVLRAYAQRDFGLLGAVLDAQPGPASRVVEQAADTLVRLSSYSRAR